MTTTFLYGLKDNYLDYFAKVWLGNMSQNIGNFYDLVGELYYLLVLYL